MTVNVPCISSNVISNLFDSNSLNTPVHILNVPKYQIFADLPAGGNRIEARSDDGAELEEPGEFGHGTYFCKISIYIWAEHSDGCTGK